jgi:hypothetical protein
MDVFFIFMYVSIYLSLSMYVRKILTDKHNLAKKELDELYQSNT